MHLPGSPGSRLALVCTIILAAIWPSYAAAPSPDQLLENYPASIRTVLQNTTPLSHSRKDSLPLFVLPISQALANVADTVAESALKELHRRGIAYTVAWTPGDATNSVREAIRIGRMQQHIGMEIAADATSCLMSFYDGTPDTLHIDDLGNPFAETSFGGQLGCPLALEHRIPHIAARVARFVREYHQNGLHLSFVCADWEVDGPMEWNNAWESSKKCKRCREGIREISDFRTFQHHLRTIRSRLQREAFSRPVLQYFPRALVGNYGVNPHDGFRYWYDYFENEVRSNSGIPLRIEGKAAYREWAHEFPGTGYTFANPVIYTWHRSFAWYDFPDPDFRWFHNLLREGSSAARHTPSSVPLIPFVHWTTTDPPKPPAQPATQFTPGKYKDLLWHLLLRGHDTFFLWCMPAELAQEIRLVHEVYSNALNYRDFLRRGTPVNFDVPATQEYPVISALQLGEDLLVLRTDFASHPAPASVYLALSDGRKIAVPPANGLQTVHIPDVSAPAGLLRHRSKTLFPIGSYELPRSTEELLAMANAGFNLVLCKNREDLDRAQAAGLMGWMPVPVQSGNTVELQKLVQSVAGHPSLMAWEGPDEFTWNFTAFSGLEKSAGFTREDWQSQKPKAVEHAASEAARLIPKLREGIHLVRQLDPQARPFWINEAADSDVAYTREYLDEIDITGCDFYAVRSTGTDLATVGRLVERWKFIGKGKPVWMVLQGFSWHSIKPERSRLYPTHFESRFMAFDAIARGAKGLFYWGTWMIDSPEFRNTIHQITREIASLNPFLCGEEQTGIKAHCIPDAFDAPICTIQTLLRKDGNDFMLLLVNEDNSRHPGVEVTGLERLEGRRLFGNDQVIHKPLEVTQGRIVVRMQPREVLILTTIPAQPGSTSTPRR